MEKEFQKKIINKLTEIGYKPLNLSLGTSFFNDDALLCTDVLERQLKNINHIQFNESIYNFSQENINKSITDLKKNALFPDLNAATQKAYNMLVYGNSYEENIENQSKSYNLKFIDWENIENNEFHFCTELNTKLDFGVDIILFVNGIPLVILEFKSNYDKKAIDRCITLLTKLQKLQGAQTLLTYTQFMIALTDNDAMYSCIPADKFSWIRWTEETKKAHQNKSNSKGENILDSICAPKRLLDLIHNFCLYNNGQRLTPTFYQYFGVKKVLDNVKQLSSNQRKGGILHQTIGSRKTTTMALLAKTLLTSNGQPDTKVILISDRKDIDEQMSTSFYNCNLPVKRASTGKELKALINKKEKLIITTVIQKFLTSENQDTLFNDSSDIFILIDEIQRSNKNLGNNILRRSFPNACFIGFTSYPIKENKEIYNRLFGDILYEYSYSQALNDNKILPVKYSRRTLKHDSTVVPNDFLEKIAENISQHFLNNYKNTELKGLVTVDNVENAFLLKDLLDKMNAISSEVITYSDKYAVSTKDYFHKKSMHQKNIEEKILKNYRTTRTPEILITVERLLNGFDSPNASVLYVIRKMNHLLTLQSIARINSPFKNKSYCEIIDYFDNVNTINELTQYFNKAVPKIQMSYIANEDIKIKLYKAYKEFFNNIEKKIIENAVQQTLAIKEAKNNIDLQVNIDAKKETITEIEDILIFLNSNYNCHLNYNQIDALIDIILEIFFTSKYS